MNVLSSPNPNQPATRTGECPGPVQPAAAAGAPVPPLTAGLPRVAWRGRERRSLPKYQRAADVVLAMIADGALRPGQAAPSGAALSRLTGFSTLTCRKGLRFLLADGALVEGASANARLRVPCDDVPRSAAITVREAVRALSAELAARRRAAGLTQIELAGLVGKSVTTIGHAETGRVWQSRDFWDLADAALDAGGSLLDRHDALCQAASASGTAAESALPDPPPPAAPHLVGSTPGTRADYAGAVQAHVGGVPPAVPVQVQVTWSDGTVTSFPAAAHTTAPGPGPPAADQPPGLPYLPYLAC